MIESAKRCLQQQSKGIDAKKGRVLLYSSRDEPSNSDILKKEIDDLKEQLRPKTNEVNQLSDPVKTLKMQNETYQSQLQKFAHTTEKTTFSYKCLTGLCVENFDCLFACVDPYISAIIYPNCKTHQQRKLTELKKELS